MSTEVSLFDAPQLIQDFRLFGKIYIRLTDFLFISLSIDICFYVTFWDSVLALQYFKNSDSLQSLPNNGPTCKWRKVHFIISWFWQSSACNYLFRELLYAFENMQRFVVFEQIFVLLRMREKMYRISMRVHSTFIFFEYCE